ncbi:MAG: hypothetical protein COB02_01840 [Candidatus Cloacimonadota bacterium]|nr:MAG: hypothetical protein COB02_01840 [Candidatus Cloacimonadota bacterium]
MDESQKNLKEKKLEMIQMTINQSDEHPLKSFVHVLGGILVFLSIVYCSLKVVIDASIYLMPDSTAIYLTKSLGDIIIFNQESSEKNETQKYVQDLLNRLKENSSLKNVDIEVIIRSDSTLNALSYPGYKIVVNQGLLEFVKSENELAFILGHELGHYHYRHLLKRLSSSVLDFSVAIITLISGVDTSIVKTLSANLNKQFSQRQESESDDYALKLVDRTYDGNSSGATDFFEKLSKTEGFIRNSLNFLFTHPLSKDRVSHLKTSIEDFKMSDKGLTPLPKNIFILDNISKKEEDE